MTLSASAGEKRSHPFSEGGNELSMNDFDLRIIIFGGA